ncbi:hypothetical protein [Micromonospora robiginosa]|uniref:Uncharacterized protein n=1 Tax=Micromonospora robiginosa TaxID=2749844 RepID=A0A7L6B4X5_9ACTN|nr:hypothetical protein [Micromonospora ferruginea]QLQ36964.1 hypothetical protein H1D33_27640 [Micromonospora ferruginea]
MSGFDEYAALIRELSTRQRGGERAIAAEAQRRRELQSGVDTLGRRLAAQGAHLDRLGEAIGTPMTSLPDAPPAGPAPAAAPGTTAGPGPAGAPGPVNAPGRTGAPGSVGASGAGTGHGSGAGSAASAGHGRGTGDGTIGGGAAAPGRSGVGAYPDGSMPTGDPAADLAAAGRLADAADRHGQETEALARRPVLLPTWSAPARAVAVYAGCALVGSLLMLIALVGSPLPVSGMDLVAAVSCAGVPLMSFLAGQLVLARWGRPVLADGETPPGRYVPLGFVICALVSPSLFCLYLVLFRLLR